MKTKLFLSLLLLSFLQTPLLAKELDPRADSKAGIRDGEPLLWNVDIFQELNDALHIPNIKNKKVYYTKLTIQEMFKDDGFDFPTQPARNRKQPGFDLQRGDKNVSGLIPKGQSAKPGDIVPLTYFQKLEIYLPELEKTVTISAVRGGHLSVHPYDLSDDVEKATYHKLVETGGEVIFAEPKKEGTLKKVLKTLKGNDENAS